MQKLLNLSNITKAVIYLLIIFTSFFTNIKKFLIN